MLRRFANQPCVVPSSKSSGTIGMAKNCPWNTNSSKNDKDYCQQSSCVHLRLPHPLYLFTAGADRINREENHASCSGIYRNNERCWGLAISFVIQTVDRRRGGHGVIPQEQIDVTAVKASLLEIGQAQRIYVNAHGAYGTLDQLRADGPPHLGSERRGYVFRVEPRGATGFQATAAPADKTMPWPGSGCRQTDAPVAWVAATDSGAPSVTS